MIVLLFKEIIQLSLPHSFAAAGTSPTFSSLPEDQRRRLIKEATALREALLSRPEEVAVLRGKNPTLADALVTGTTLLITHYSLLITHYSLLITH